MSNTKLCKWDFFIAHSSKDKKIAEMLYDRLKEKSRPFLDSRCLQLGVDWDIEIRDAQENSLVTIVLISRTTEKAYYQREEIAAAIAIARENSEHRVVPVYLDEEASQSKSIPYGLRLKNGITISDAVDLSNIQEQLLNLKSQMQRLSSTDIDRTDAQPDLAMTVGIAVSDLEPWDSDDTALGYELNRTPDLVELLPSMPYLNTYSKGGPIEPVGFNWVPFTWDFPNLDIKVVNNSCRTVFLTEACFYVESSQLDPEPLLLISPDDSGNNALHLRVLNEGWGTVRNLRVLFNLSPIANDSPVSTFSTPYAYEVSGGDFEEDINIDLSSAFKSAGVDVDGMKQLLDVPHESRGHGFAEKITDMLGPFPENGANLAGEIVFEFKNINNQKKSHSVRFSTVVHIVNQYLCGIPAPPTYQYSGKFDVNGSNYQRRVAISHVLKPGETDRFNIKIGVDRSSIHNFCLTLLHNNGQELSSPPMTMKIMVPRSGAQFVDERSKPIFSDTEIDN